SASPDHTGVSTEASSVRSAREYSAFPRLTVITISPRPHGRGTGGSAAPGASGRSTGGQGRGGTGAAVSPGAALPPAGGGAGSSGGSGRQAIGSDGSQPSSCAETAAGRRPAPPTPIISRIITTMRP